MSRKQDVITQLNSYPDIDRLAEETVLYAMRQYPECDFFEPQTTDSIFYKVYNELCNRRAITYGSYFAMRLKNAYEIDIPIQ